MLVASGLFHLAEAWLHTLSRTFRLARESRRSSSGSAFGVRSRQAAVPARKPFPYRLAVPRLPCAHRSGLPSAWPKPCLPSAFPAASRQPPDGAPLAASAVRVICSEKPFPRVFRHCCGHRCQHLEVMFSSFLSAVSHRKFRFVSIDGPERPWGGVPADQPSAAGCAGAFCGGCTWTTGIGNRSFMTSSTSTSIV